MIRLDILRGDAALRRICREDRMRWVCTQIKEVSPRARRGRWLREGEPSRGFFVLLEGEIHVPKLTDGVPIPGGHQTAPAFFGEIPLLAQSPVR